MIQNIALVRCKTKTNFASAWCRLHAFASSSHWCFVLLFKFVVTGIIALVLVLRHSIENHSSMKLSEIKLSPAIVHVRLKVISQH